MSTPEVTPESLRAHATWLNDRGAKESHMALTRWADDLEREQRSLRAERDDLRAQVAESQDWANRMTVDRDLFLGELLVAREKLARAECVITDFRAARQEIPHG